jgi:hypothetical protein
LNNAVYRLTAVREGESPIFLQAVGRRSKEESGQAVGWQNVGSNAKEDEFGKSVEKRRQSAVFFFWRQFTFYDIILPVRKEISWKP